MPTHKRPPPLPLGFPLTSIGGVQILNGMAQCYVMGPNNMKTTTVYVVYCKIKTTIDCRLGMGVKCSLKQKLSKRVVQDWFSKYVIVYF